MIGIGLHVTAQLRCNRHGPAQEMASSITPQNLDASKDVVDGFLLESGDLEELVCLA